MNESPNPNADIAMNEASHCNNCTSDPENNLDVQELKMFNPGNQFMDCEDEEVDWCSLDSYSYDYEAIRKALARMVIIDKWPFYYLRREGFTEFTRTLMPFFTIPSTLEVAKDCWKLFVEERKKVHRLINGRRLCLSTCIWNSIYGFYYMCLTAYWINDEWKLSRRILNFRQMSDCKAETVAEEIELCLKHWGIDKILTLTLDDGSNNDLLIEQFKSKTEKLMPTSAVLDNECLHVRSYVHILSLVVKDCLEEENAIIVKIRNAVSYVNYSFGYETFQKCVEEEKIEGNRLLYSDVETMWNSTYLMLEQAVKFEKAFDRLLEDDPYFKSYFIEEEIEGPPCKADWERARILVEFLSVFYDLTSKFSSSMQVTSSTFFHEIFEVQAFLNEWIESEDILLSEMARNVKCKFEKYWENFSITNYLLYIAAVLDPRYKLEFLAFGLGQMYDEEKSSEVLSKVESILRRLYEFYESTSPVNGKKGRGKKKNKCKLRRAKYLQFLKVKKSVEKKPELERYLQACTVRDVEDFDILNWWKRNKRRYPRLSRMAMEVLAVSVTAVASEPAFFMNGNFLDEYKSSLNQSPGIIEVLICTQNWLCPNEAPYDLREEISEREEYDGIAGGV